MSLDRAADGHHEIRPGRSSNHLGEGSLACPECDAPVRLAAPVTPAEPLVCPFCLHSAPVREFLSLRRPARPARVQVFLRLTV